MQFLFRKELLELRVGKTLEIFQLYTTIGKNIPEEFSPVLSPDFIAYLCWIYFARINSFLSSLEETIDIYDKYSLFRGCRWGSSRNTLQVGEGACCVTSSNDGCEGHYDKYTYYI